MSCQNPQRYYPVLGDTRVLGWCKECVDVMNQIGYPIKDVDWRVTKKPVASWYGMAYEKLNMVILNSKLLEEEENAVRIRFYTSWLTLLLQNILIMGMNGNAFVKRFVNLLDK